MQPTKVEIPEALKNEVPHTFFGRVLSATPVVMAVVATMLASLATSEMTRAQYERSLAGQQQAKAGDQWSFFQAKRLRGALQHNIQELLLSLTPTTPFNSQTLQKLASSGTSPVQARLQKLTQIPETQAALQALEKSELPAVPPAPVLPTEVQDALKALHNPAGEAELNRRMIKMKPDILENAVKASREQSQAFDALTGPLNDTIEELNALLITAAGTSGDAAVYKDFNLARLRLTAARYETEARLNQSLAYLYELQVRRSNLSAERHHTRSQIFFFGMLAAQAGVIIATFAMAARQRNVLWSIAAIAGLIAIAFAVYVYLYV